MWLRDAVGQEGRRTTILYLPTLRQKHRESPSSSRLEVTETTRFKSEDGGLRLYLDAWSDLDLELLSIKVEMELRRRHPR